MLFQVDQAENDRLLLQEAQRKQDLIDFAVRRFAPHLEGRTDVQVVNLYSTNATLRKEIRAIVGGKTIVVEHVMTPTKVPKAVIHEVVREGAFLELPAQADLVATKTALNKKIEWLAARLNAMPIVLPEATDYLVARLKKQRVLTIVGGEQTK